MTLKQHVLLVLESATVYLVTLKRINPTTITSYKNTDLTPETTLLNLVKLNFTKLCTYKSCIKFFLEY